MERATRHRPRLGPELGDAERAYVFSIAMRYVRNEADAEDIAQDALFRAHRYRDSFRGESRFSTWLYRIAATSALMHLRSRRRKAREVSRDVWNDSACARARAPGPSAEGVASAREELEQVAEKIRNLGDLYEDVFWLRFAAGYTEAEVAEAMDLPLTTVKTRSFRARKSVTESVGVAA